MARYLYSALSSAIGARRNCELSGNTEWFARHTSHIEELVKDHMPSGSGFDSGTTLDLESSHADKLVFHTSFHHMAESGMYDGWTEHTVTATPSFDGLRLRVSGRNRNDIKEYIHEVFSSVLEFDLEPGMRYQAIAERTGCKVVSKWLDGCAQVWSVVIPKREHTYTPAVGERVKLATMNAYTSIGIPAWSWLEVTSVIGTSVSFHVLNGVERTNMQSAASLSEFSIPIGWSPAYDADEIVSDSHKSWVDAQASAVELLAEVK